MIAMAKSQRPVVIDMLSSSVWTWAARFLSLVTWRRRLVGGPGIKNIRVATQIWCLVSPILIVLLNTIVNNGIVSPTLNVNPNIICHSLEFFWGIIVYSVAITITYQMIFHPHFNHGWQYFITSWWQEEVGFWPRDEPLLENRDRNNRNSTDFCCFK